MNKPYSKSQGGFTIIELMIATVIFSVVLVTLSASIIQISRMFYKGLAQSKTQEVTRAIVTDIAQSLRFEPDDMQAGLDVAGNPNIHAYCLGTNQYSFIMGVQLGTNPGNLPHVLVRDNVPGCPGQQAKNFTVGVIKGEELLSDKMRLAKFEIAQVQPNQPLWRVTARVVLGDDDIVCAAGYHIPSSPAGLGSCDDPTSLTVAEINSHLANLRCKNIRAGSQFCAVSELSTIVEKRIQP